MTKRLASGHVFVFRKMPIPVMAELLTIVGMNIPPGTPMEKVEEMTRSQVESPEFKMKIIEAASFVLPHCVVSPVIEKTPTDPSHLSIDDIEPGDLMESFTVILEHSGLTKATAAMREKFREESPQ